MRLPALRADKHACDSPHVFILGAGASRAACPDGDANGHKLPLMADLVDTTGLTSHLDTTGIPWEGRNFEELYAEIASNAELAGVADTCIREYFAGLVLPPTVTLYDRILLSLRSKDVIATFNWDPLLAYAFSRNRHVSILPRVLFLHGNVAVGVCEKHRQKGFVGEHACRECGASLTGARLLYPVEEKGYTDDPFIANVWAELRDAIARAYLLTIIGYAAPDSDVEAKKIMLDAWRANDSNQLGEVDIIDVKDKGELERTWRPIFRGTHYSTSKDPRWLFSHPRRTCDHFAMATLQQHPCTDNPFPDTSSLHELQDWVRPLVLEEADLEENGVPLPC